MKKDAIKDFVPYEHAVALKELGFDEPCFRFQNNISHIIEEKGWLNWNEVEQFISLPIFSQAFRWFRIEYSIDSHIRPNISINVPKTYQFIIDDNIDDEWHMSYEEAELACLKKLIEIVKNK